MSPEREWKFLLTDIVDAIERVQEYTSGMTYEGFTSDRRTIDAVTYNFVIIGEAARRMPPARRAQHPEIEWDEMMAMRHILAHEYESVARDIVWSTIQENLPPLRAKLQRILEQLS